MCMASTVFKHISLSNKGIWIFQQQKHYYGSIFCASSVKQREMVIRCAGVSQSYKITSTVLDNSHILGIRNIGRRNCGDDCQGDIKIFPKYERRIIRALKKDCSLKDSLIIILNFNDDRFSSRLLEESPQGIITSNERSSNQKPPKQTKKEDTKSERDNWLITTRHPFMKNDKFLTDDKINRLIQASFSQQTYDCCHDGDSPVKILGMFPPSSVAWKRFLDFWLRDITHNSGLFALGRRLPVYMIVNDFQKKILCGASQTTRQSLFVYKHLQFQQLMFRNCFQKRVVTEIPHEEVPKHFSRLFQVKQNTTQQMKAFFDCVDPDRYYIVKVTPKADLFQSVSPREELATFSNLLRHFIMKSKGTRLIPYLEQFLPGIGLALIHADYTMSETTADIDYLNFASFYQILRSHPDFNSSPLLSKEEMPTGKTKSDALKHDTSIDQIDSISDRPSKKLLRSQNNTILL